MAEPQSAPQLGHAVTMLVAPTTAKARTLETAAEEWLSRSEIAELRRSDINLHASTLLVRRSVSRSRINGVHVKGPKSGAGNRDMHIPAAVMSTLRKHLQTYVTGRDGLLFPGHTEIDANGSLVEVRHSRRQPSTAR